MNSFYEHAADSKEVLNIFEHNTTSIGTHFHPSIEFVYTVSGKTDFFYDGYHYTVGQDEIYAVPSMIIHGNSSIGENQIISIVFAKEFFKTFENDFPNQFFQPVLSNHEKNRNILNLIKDCIHAWVKHNYNIPRIKKLAFINSFLYELTEIYPLRPITEQKTSSLIIDALSYINENYSQPITLNELAKKFHYSAPHFSVLFNKYVGINLHSYINNIRIQKVLEMKSNPKNSQSLISIALDCGFNSQASFYRALQQYRQNYPSNM